MKWASTLSRDTTGAGAASRAIDVLDRELGTTPDLVLLFVSSGLLKEAPAVVSRLRERYPNATLIGCSGAGVIGASREVEDVPAIAVVAASLPRVQLEARALRSNERLEFSHAPKAVLLFGDPFSFEAEATLEQLDDTFPGVVAMGGMASGGSTPGSHRLFLDERVHTSGAVCVALSGELSVEPLIAQGCRPLGTPMFATAVDGHLLLELDGKSPIDVMQKLHAASPPDVQERMRHSLVVGVGLKTGSVHADAAELLIRNLVGLEPKRKAVAVASVLEPLQVVQFMLRDARAAEEELVAKLAGVTSAPAGALLFSCTGRGRGLFGVDDHDAGLFASKFPGTPLGGFFCNGEFGPVSGRTWMHGFTSALALFRAVTH